MGRRRWRAFVVIAGLGALPLLVPIFGYLHNQVRIDDVRGQLEMMLHSREHRHLSNDWNVYSSETGCSAIVAVSFATQAPRDGLNLNTRGRAADLGLAWNEAGQPVVEFPLDTRSNEVPAAVKNLLQEWLIGVDDGERTVLFERIELPNGWDVRCW